MQVPDYSHIVRDVFNAGIYNLRSHEDCGRFTEACVRALHAADPNFGHLRKPAGKNHVVDAQGNRHAVDSVLYKSLGWATDIIMASASQDPNETPGPSWQPDPQPYYTAADWYAPVGLPPGDEETDVDTPKPPQPKPVPAPEPHKPACQCADVLEAVDAVYAKLAIDRADLEKTLKRMEDAIVAQRAIELKGGFLGTIRGVMK